MTPGRRAARTFATGVGAAGLGVLLGFLVTPILLRELGPERLGLFRTASEWAGYVTLLDLGVGTGTAVLLSRALGNRDRAAAVEAVAAGGRAYRRVAVLAAVAVVALIVAAPGLARGTPPHLVAELRWGLAVCLLTQLLLPLAAFRPLAEAQQRGHVVQLALAAQLGVAAVAGVMLALAGGGLAGQFAAVALGVAVYHALLTWDGVRHFPELRARAGWKSETRVGTFDGWVLLFHLSGRAARQSDGILLGFLLGPAAVVPVLLTQRLILAAESQATAVGGAAWAPLADLYHRGEREVFTGRLVELTRMTGLLALSAAVPLAVVTRPFVAAWVGPDHYAGAGLVVATAVGAWLQPVVTAWLWPLTATGFVRTAAILTGIGAAVNLVVGVAATLLLGPVGPAVGTVAGLAGVGVWAVPLALRRTFGMPLRPLVGAVVGPVLAVAPWAVGLSLIGSVAGWAEVIGVAAGGGLGCLLTGWALAIPAAERAAWRNRVFRRASR